MTIKNNDAVKIVGGAILINGNIQTVSADVARVIVESVDGHDVPQITQMDVDVDVVGGNINIGQTEACKQYDDQLFSFITNGIILMHCFL